MRGPTAAPELRVPLREIILEATANEPNLPVYDTTGVYSDPDVTIDVEKGLDRTRIEWVKERGGVEQYEGRPIQAGRQRQRHRQTPGAQLPQHAEAVAGRILLSLPASRGGWRAQRAGWGER